MGRDRVTQAILPLRGKVLNTAKAKLVDILGNEEIATIINTIGAGIQENFNLKKLSIWKNCYYDRCWYRWCAYSNITFNFLL